MCDELAELGRAAKRSRRSARAAAAALDRTWKLTGSERRVALGLYMMADAVAEPVVLYLKQIGRQRHWPDRADDDVERLIVNEYLRADMCELLALTDEAHPLDAGALAQALRRLAEWSVVTWTRCQNDKGICPSSIALMDQLRQRRPDFLKRRADSRPLPASGGGGARKHVARLRVRYGAHMGRMRPREELPIATMQAKVSWRSHLVNDLILYVFGRRVCVCVCVCVQL